ncbi:hypothetical protein QQ045_027737 [Rhodiola kirilowii]
MAATSFHPWVWILCMMLFTVFASNEVHGQCLEQQKSLLLQMKNGFTNIPLPKKLPTWDSSKDCCVWSGVTCSSNGYVTGLDLSGERIEGGLNETNPLFDLQYLTSLNLSLNDFEDAMPSAFGKLANLVHLDLSRSGFQGNIPIGISNLTRLVTLDLSSLYDFGLKVDSSPSLKMLVGNLSRLVELRLNDVDLKIQASEWCQVISSSVPYLQVLSLKSTRLSGPIPSSLQTLESLSVVDLSSNYFSTPFPEFFTKFKNLTWLGMGDCELSGKFPDKILEMQTLRFLDLSDNSFIPSNLSISLKHSSLETLELARTTFSNTIPESIGEAKMLSKLDLSECLSLVGHIPQSISQLAHLVYLDLSFNSLSGSVPSFSLAKNLKQLDLGVNQLSGSLLSTDWKQLSQLETVSFRSNSLSGSIPASIFGIPSLQGLNLYRNHFTGFTNEFIEVPSPQLAELYINLNELQGKFPAFIFGLQGLVNLDLSDNNFGDTLHMKLAIFSETFYSISRFVQVERNTGFPQDLNHNYEFGSFRQSDSWLNTKLDLEH